MAELQTQRYDGIEFVSIRALADGIGASRRVLLDRCRELGVEVYHDPADWRERIILASDVAKVATPRPASVSRRLASGRMV